MLRTTTICLISILTLGASLARGQDYYPTGTGWHWTYFSNIESQEMVAEILPEMRTVRGRETFVLFREVSSPYWDTRTAHWFMSKDTGGDVYFHGYENLNTGEEVSFEPPVLIVDQPLFLGQLWATRTVSYAGLDVGGEELLRFIESYRVDEDAFYDYPDGTLYCLGLIRTLSVSPGGDRSPLPPDLARYLDRDEVGFYYAEGIGLVVEFFLELTSYRRPTSATAATWGSIKSAFR